MKKKILTSVIITVLFALIIITSSFVALISMQEIENTKEILTNYTSIIGEDTNLAKNEVNYFKVD